MTIELFSRRINASLERTDWTINQFPFSLYCSWMNNNYNNNKKDDTEEKNPALVLFSRHARHSQSIIYSSQMLPTIPSSLVLLGPEKDPGRCWCNCCSEVSGRVHSSPLGQNQNHPRLWLVTERPLVSFSPPPLACDATCWFPLPSCTWTRASPSASSRRKLPSP